MADNLDTLFKRAMMAASKGRNSGVRKKAVSRVRNKVMLYGGYTWACIGPKKGGCANGAVIIDDPQPVIGAKSSPARKKRKARMGKETAAVPAKRAKTVAVKKPGKKVKKTGKKVWTNAERKAFAEKMKAARAAKRGGKAKRGK